jgi:lysophospholipase L1-like esterase
MTIASEIARLTTDIQRLNDILTGGESTIVIMEDSSVKPSISKAIADKYTALELKRRPTRYDNLRSNSDFSRGTGGNSPYPAYVGVSIVKPDANWSPHGVKRVLRMDILQDWIIADFKYTWYSNLVSDGEMTISLDSEVDADFHAGDTVYCRFKYRSNVDTSVHLQSRSNSGSVGGWIGIYQSLSLPSTAGVVIEKTIQLILSDPNVLQAFANLVFFASSSQSLHVDDYVELAEIVCTKSATDAGCHYLHASKDENQVNHESKKILIFGDSISQIATIDQTTGVYTATAPVNRWPTYIQGLLNASSVKSYACSGAHVKDDTGLTFWQWISNQIAKAIQFSEEADIVIIKAGTNDGVTSFGDYNTAISKTLNNLDRTLLYEALMWHFWTIRTNWATAECFYVIPIQRASSDLSTYAAKHDVIKVMAKRYNFTIIDAESNSGIVKDFESVGANGRYLEDGLHTNTSGARRLARYISAMIKNYFSY